MNRFHFLLRAAALGALLGVCVPHAQAATIADKGDFLVAYPTLKDPAHLELQKALKGEKVLEALAQGLNETLALPQNITICFDELGEANAFYDPNTHRITVSYELMDDLQELFSKANKDEDAALDQSLNATFFVLFHELGHALIDVYDLPVVGKEEDAVDQLSVVILGDSEDETNAANDDNKMVLDGARAFLLLADRDEKTLSQMTMWDEHSLSKQRFYNILTLVYGSNPEKHKDLVTSKVLPEGRAERAESEWARVSNAWVRLLEPFVKE